MLLRCVDGYEELEFFATSLEQPEAAEVDASDEEEVGETDPTAVTAISGVDMMTLKGKHENQDTDSHSEVHFAVDITSNSDADSHNAKKGTETDKDKSKKSTSGLSVETEEKEMCWY